MKILNNLAVVLLSVSASLSACADTENLITISANGTRTTYSFDSFLSARIADPNAETLTLNVNFNDGTQSSSNIRTIIHEVVKEDPQEEVEVKVDSTSATFTWPPVEGAETYQLIIYKDYSTGERYCTLTFNSSGQLINIDFNPRGPSTKAAQSVFSFTVTGLEKGKTYSYVMTALGSSGQELEKAEGSFETVTTDANETPENIINVYTRNKTVVVDCDKESAIMFFDTMGHQVGDCLHTQHCECTVTLSGVYIVNINNEQYKIRID